MMILNVLEVKEKEMGDWAFTKTRVSALTKQMSKEQQGTYFVITIDISVHAIWNWHRSDRWKC